MRSSGSAAAQEAPVGVADAVPDAEAADKDTAGRGASPGNGPGTQLGQASIGQEATTEKSTEPGGLPREDADAAKPADPKADSDGAPAPSAPALAVSPRRQTRGGNAASAGRTSPRKSPTAIGRGTPQLQPTAPTGGSVFMNPVFDADPARDAGAGSTPGDESDGDGCGAAENACGAASPGDKAGSCADSAGGAGSFGES